MQLIKVLEGLETTNHRALSIPAVDIHSIENDSRKVDKDSLFVAASGYVEDAHIFIDSAYKNGCRYFVVEVKRQSEFQSQYPEALFLAVENIHLALARIAKNFYQDPSSKMKLIGITGTSGKTTTAFVVYAALRSMNINTGLIGTIEYRLNDEIVPATNTTPDILYLNKIMAQMLEREITHLVMEVSSHALELGRVAGLEFELAAFTNFSQDHLDFHKNMEEYLQAKLKIFDLLSISKKEKITVIVNKDMAEWGIVLEYAKKFSKVTLKTISTKNPESSYYSQVQEMLPSHSHFKLNRFPVLISMMGITNIYNFTLAIAILLELGFEISLFKDNLKNIHVAGRMEKIKLNTPYSVIVDYAHKPDALEKLLKTIREVVHNSGKVITVFGAGGDRDKSKRPIMGKIAGNLSDFVVLTSDNPRTEDPFAILNEIEAGLKETGFTKYVVEKNRSKAIYLALSKAEPDDVVVIAGKGHEDYQILGKTKVHFSDKEEVEKFFGL
jgi:UDP-N-acetylmuramoyl-L-alanyl-D-glutamate--2,6-diaminopimelate ligase